MADESRARKKELILESLQRVIDKGFVMIYLLAVCGKENAHILGGRYFHCKLDLMLGL